MTSTRSRGLPGRLPTPHTEAWDWQLRAACRNSGDAVFFPADGERPSQRDRREQRAKAYCVTCPVQRECLHYALFVQEPFGVWGGLNADERQRLSE